jgi:large subunit ribosomal protein L24
MNFKKNDLVLVLKGKDRNKTGKVEKVLTKQSKLVIKGINIAKKHIRPTRANPHGGIIDMTVPINMANTMIICPRCSQPTRVGIKRTLKEKFRICKRCGESLELVEEKQISP